MFRYRRPPVHWQMIAAGAPAGPTTRLGIPIHAPSRTPCPGIEYSPPGCSGRNLQRCWMRLKPPLSSSAIADRIALRRETPESLGKPAPPNHQLTQMLAVCGDPAWPELYRFVYIITRGIGWRPEAVGFRRSSRLRPPVSSLREKTRIRVVTILLMIYQLSSVKSVRCTSWRLRSCQSRRYSCLSCRFWRTGLTRTIAASPC